MRIGIDTGGTFTDFVVLHDDGRIASFKIRSNPAAPAEVILEGLGRIGADSGVRPAEVVHGSTVATNALLERKGARTAFVTTRGFEDLIAIPRQNRPELYNLSPPLAVPLVPHELCFGVDERILFNGTIERVLDTGTLANQLSAAGIESVAICLLHSWRNQAHERALLSALESSGIYLAASCDISPEFREFERASTTVINAYVGPLMDRYLGDLERRSPHPVSIIMQSNGGLLTAAEARRHAVRTILSGPAGGIVGAVKIARTRGLSQVLTFDMGGTSTDVALAGIEPRLTTEAQIDGVPVRIPMLDINTVGAGGGSIAWVDSGGSLRVGPQSAGASPGPACYGVGTDRPSRMPTMPAATLSRSADLRYAGQSYELTVPHTGSDPTVSAFRQRRHQQIYGYSDPQRITEIVTVRLGATLPITKPPLIPQAEPSALEADTTRRIRISGKWRDARVATRASFEIAASGTAASGPLLISDYGATTLVPLSWSAAIDEARNLILTRA